MSRGRRQYLPLDLEESDGERSRGRGRPKRDARIASRWADATPYCTTILGYLPSVLAPCGDSGARAAYDELLESLEDLEYRHAGLVESIKKERDAKASEAQAAITELTELRQSLSEAEERGSSLQRDLATAHEQTRAAETDAQGLAARLAAADTENAAARDSLREAQDEAHQLATSLQTEQDEHADTQAQLAAATASVSELSADVEAVRRDVAALQSQLSNAEAGAAQQAADASRRLEEVQAALGAELASAHAEVERQSALAADADAAHATLQSQLAGEQDVSAGLRVELAAAAAEAAVVAGSMSATAAERKAAEARQTAEREAAQARLAAERKAVESLRRELEDMRQDKAAISTRLASAERNLADSEEQMRVVFSEGQAVKAELAAARREGVQLEQLVAVAREETACLQESLEAANEEGMRLAGMLQETEAKLATLQPGSPEAAGQPGHDREAIRARSASAAGPSSDADSALESPHRDRRKLWDSAADIVSPPETQPQVASAIDEGLHEDFCGRPEWLQLWQEGSASGWLATCDEVERGDVVGQGSFGTTYAGVFRGEPVAVKCVRVEQPSHYQTFVREVGALSRLRHANVMRLVAAVLQPPQTCWLITEFLAGGTLAEWLHGREGRGAPRRNLQEKLAIGLGVARGMLMLESTDPPVLHRDLKPSNVLLDADGVPKIADFGLCRDHLEDQAYTYTGETGSYTYMSPEMMRGDIYGPATDVYSFAILMTEIMKQRPPFEEHYLTPMQTAEGVAYHDLRPQLPSGLPGGLKPLLEACWADEPEARPTFSDVVAHMSDIAAKAPTPRRGFFS